MSVTSHMTDKDTFTALLLKAGITFGPQPRRDFPDDDVIAVGNSGSVDVGGYNGFISYWHFTKDGGQLLGVAHYE